MNSFHFQLLERCVVERDGSVHAQHHSLADIVGARSKRIRACTYACGMRLIAYSFGESLCIHAFKCRSTPTKVRRVPVLHTAWLYTCLSMQVNTDAGWLLTRDSNGNMVEDRTKFPSGMLAFGQWIHQQEYAPGQFMKYGLYTCRGTCQCSTQWYSGPGGQGYEAQVRTSSNA
jgi:hypothetical protein